MLVLRIKLGETILVGDNIRIMLTESKNGAVKLGIEAPKAVAVDRASVRQRKLESKRS